MTRGVGWEGWKEGGQCTPMAALRGGGGGPPREGLLRTDVERLQEGATPSTLNVFLIFLDADRNTVLQ